MAGSESDEEAYLTDDATSHVASAVNKCLSMKPEYSKKVKSKAKNSTVLRTQLDKFKTGSSKEKGSNRLDSRKQLDDYFRELAADFTTLSKKFETILECLTSTFDRLDLVEARLEKLENTPSAPIPTTYAHVIRQSPDYERIDKLE